jgi:agmatinase
MTEELHSRPTPPGSTFLGAPFARIDEIEPGMLVVGGVPSGISGDEAGVVDGPRAIRAAASARENVIDLERGWIRRRRPDAMLVDIGDLDTYGTQVELMTREVSAQMEEIVRRGGFPVMLGGDHYVTYPLFLGYHDAKRAADPDHRIGYIQIDATWTSATTSRVWAATGTARTPAAPASYRASIRAT